MPVSVERAYSGAIKNQGNARASSRRRLSDADIGLWAYPNPRLRLPVLGVYRAHTSSAAGRR